MATTAIKGCHRGPVNKAYVNALPTGGPLRGCTRKRICPSPLPGLCDPVRICDLAMHGPEPCPARPMRIIQWNHLACAPRCGKPPQAKPMERQYTCGCIHTISMHLEYHCFDAIVSAHREARQISNLLRETERQKMEATAHRSNTKHFSGRKTHSSS